MTYELLFEYSEWLDRQGVIKSDGTMNIWSGGGVEPVREVVDNRSHDQLVRDFLKEVEGGQLSGRQEGLRVPEPARGVPSHPGQGSKQDQGGSDSQRGTDGSGSQADGTQGG